jgi:hypothetical protein
MSGRLRSGLLAVLLGAALLLAVAPTNALGLFTGSTAVDANSISTNTLAPPTGLAASVSGTSVTLTWTATPSSFASGYNVLRSTTSGGPYTQIAQVTPRTTLTYVDSTVTAGTTYYYVLQSYYQSWVSTSTAQVSATPCTPSIAQSAIGGGTAGSVSATFAAVPTPGRLLVAVAATRIAGALTTPAGWTPAIVETNTGFPSQAVFYKLAGAAEPSLVTVTTAATGNGNGIHLYELTCVTTFHATGSTTGNSTAVSSGTVVTTQPNTFVLAALVARQGNNFNNTWTNSFTETADFTQGAGGALTVFGSGVRTAAAAGSYATVATSNASGIWRGQVVAFR